MNHGSSALIRSGIDTAFTESDSILTSGRLCGLPSDVSSQELRDLCEDWREYFSEDYSEGYSEDFSEDYSEDCSEDRGEDRAKSKVKSEVKFKVKLEVRSEVSLHGLSKLQNYPTLGVRSRSLRCWALLSAKCLAAASLALSASREICRGYLRRVFSH